MMNNIKHVPRVMLIMVSMLYCQHTFSVVELTFDVLLEKTNYAQMLKELICMTDSLELLNHAHIDKDEKRFIEDSILGKMVRIRSLLQSIEAQRVPPEDIRYLFYWIDLAKNEETASLIVEQLDVLEQAIQEHFA